MKVKNKIIGALLIGHIIWLLVGCVATNDVIKPNLNIEKRLLSDGLKKNLGGTHTFMEPNEKKIIKKQLISLKDTKQEITLSKELKMVDNGGVLQIDFLLENQSSMDLLFVFGSGQKYDFHIYNDQGELVYRWSDGRMFTMAIKEMVIKENEQKKFKTSWDLKDKNGLVVPNGQYRMEFFVTASVHTMEGKVLEVDLSKSYTFEVEDGSLK